MSLLSFLLTVGINADTALGTSRWQEWKRTLLRPPGQGQGRESSGGMRCFSLLGARAVGEAGAGG